MPAPHILWADDEIDLLRPHILFLESRGYRVSSATNGADAVERVRRERFEVVLLDEQMPGMGGLEALAAIKRIAPDLPVVIVTKSEEEDLMEQALGDQISDYLTKPVNPSQILLTIKRLLESSRLLNEKASQQYLQSFGQISSMLAAPLSHSEWVDLYLRLIAYDLSLGDDNGVRQVLEDQYQEANREFGRFIEESYRAWVAGLDRPPDASRPLLSHEVVPRVVLPEVGDGRPVIFFVIDCMRHDQWLEFESMLAPLFAIEKSFYYSILPTATPYARNAIFSGLMPNDLERRYPALWSEGEEDEHSRNRNEEAFLGDMIARQLRQPVMPISSGRSNSQPSPRVPG